MSTLFETYARGKLLLSGEYFVLDGAVALAVPVRFGQSLRVDAGKTPGQLVWTSREPDGTAWFEGVFDKNELDIISENDPAAAQTLQSILQACRRQEPSFLKSEQGLEVSTQTDFPREWGLGTSSTLLAAIGRWAQVNPYLLLFETLGGSGYDIACAYAEGPLLYQLNKSTPEVQQVDYQPFFSENIYFVYLGTKQNSREGIRRYREKSRHLQSTARQISRLTERCLSASTLGDFDAVLREHESLISRALDLPTAKTQYFQDFWGEIKSLGAWGGDFVLASSRAEANETRAYFSEKGFDVVFSWKEMVFV